MTVSSTASIVVYEGNGATTTFDYSFLIPAITDAVLTYTDADGTETVLVPSQYGITGIGDENGGTVTFTWLGSAIDNGTFLSIQRVLPLIQDTDLVNQDGFYPQVVEDALDYLTMLVQQVNTINTQAIRVPSSEDPPDELPAAALRANQTLIFDSTGQPGVGQPSSATVSAAMQPVVAAGTLADARGLLGVAGVVTATIADEAPQLTAISTNYMVSAAVTSTLLPTSQLPNGWNITIHALTNDVTVTPDAADTIFGYSLGASATVAAGTVATIVTDGDGNWWITTVISADDFIGAVRPSAGFNVPSAKYVLCDGASYLRATYPACVTAITMTVTVTKTSGTAVLGGFTSAQTAKLAAGMLVEGSGIPSGAVILTTPAGGDTSITLDQNATNSTTAPVTILPFGAADTTHFNVPDLRGRTPAGAELATNAANRLSTATAGFGAAARISKAGGLQTNTLTHDQIPAHNHGVVDPGHTHALTNGTLQVQGAGAVLNLNASGASGTPVTITANSATTGITTSNNAPADAAHANVQPTLVVNYLIRVLP